MSKNRIQAKPSGGRNPVLGLLGSAGQGASSACGTWSVLGLGCVPGQGSEAGQAALSPSASRPKDNTDGPPPPALLLPTLAREPVVVAPGEPPACPQS